MQKTKEKINFLVVIGILVLMLILDIIFCYLGMLWEFHAPTLSPVAAGVKTNPNPKPIKK